MCPILLGLPQVILVDTNRLSLSVIYIHVPRHGTKYAVFFNNVGRDFPRIIHFKLSTTSITVERSKIKRAVTLLASKTVNEY